MTAWLLRRTRATPHELAAVLWSFVYFFAYSDPATWPVTRFPGPWPGRVRVAVPSIDFGEIA